MMKIIRVLRRDLESHIHTSRNLNEGILLKIKRFIWCMVYLVKAFIVAIRGMKYEQLGSSVIYRNKNCFISNWANHSFVTLAGDNFYAEHCARSEIKNVRNMIEFYHRFNVSFSFYMSSWHMIDVNRKIYP